MTFNEAGCYISRCQFPPYALNMPQSPLLGLEIQPVPLTHQRVTRAVRTAATQPPANTELRLLRTVFWDFTISLKLDAHNIDAEVSLPSVQVKSKEPGYPRM